MASVDLQEKANFTRLSRLLVDKGTEALRNTFDAIHPPANLPAVLNANQKSLLRLKFRVINNSQWDLLFPPSANPPDSKTFDVTLLTVLFRNICGFTAPSTGWDAMPADTDRSMEANILRLKLFRNKVYAHVTSTEVDNATFKSLWQKISQALVELNVPQNDIDDLKTCPLGPEEMEIRKEYVEILKEWKSKDEECVQELECSINRLTRVTASFEKIWSKKSDEDLLQELAKHNFRGKIRSKVESFFPGTREWLLRQVDEFVEKEHESRMLLLTAGPGFGKSVFAAKVCEDFEKKGKLAASHFCDFSNSNLRDPKTMLQSLASQMCENIAGFGEKLLDQLKRPHQVQRLEDAFEIYLQNPLDELELKEPSLVVIDGLDESAADNRNEIVCLITDYFPDLPMCIKFLVTSRPGISVAQPSDVQENSIVINIDSNDAKNNSDIELYLKACLPRLADRKAEIDLLAKEKCEGSFLYAFHVQSELRKRDNLNKMTFNEIMEFVPKGLNFRYLKYFKRLEEELKAIMNGSVDVLKILEMLAVSKGPLPLSFISRALGLTPDCRETRKIINKVNEAISCLLYVSDDRVTVFHISVIDWFLAKGYKDHEYTVKVMDGNKSLWLICEKVFEEIVRRYKTSRNMLNLTNEMKYALDYGFHYLRIAGSMEEWLSWSENNVIESVLECIYPKAKNTIDEYLLGTLAKHNFKSKIRRKVEFFYPGTREWLLQRVDEFVEDKQKSRVLFLTAGPGFGKSVFAAKVCEEFKKKRKLAASHFCDFSNSNLRDPMMMLQSLASQMCENIAGFKEKLLDQLRRPYQVQSLKDAFRIYLQNPLDELDLEEPSLVVIDGLDESATNDEIMNLIADYFQELPECIKFLVTSRLWISITKLRGVQKINIDSNNAKNNSDLELYLKACLPHLADKKSEIGSFDRRRHKDRYPSVCEVLAKEKCEGSFLYAFYVQFELQKRDDLDQMTFKEIMKFVPKGLDSIYLIYFNRIENELRAIMHDSLDVLKILEMLVVSKAPLPLSFISRALGLTPDCRETRKIIDKVNETVSCLLYVSDDLVTVFHKSVIDWLLAKGYKDHKYIVKVMDGNKSLWLICEKVFEEIKKTVCSGHDLNLNNDVKYAMDHGFDYLTACSTEESLFWSVDVVIMHVFLTIYPQRDNNAKYILNLWVKILQDSANISNELQERLSWHVVEIDFLNNETKSDIKHYYLQSVLAHSPEGYFSDNEKEIAEALLSKVPRFVEYNFNEVEVLPLAAWRNRAQSDVRAVGLSHEKTMAAVVAGYRYDYGKTICVISVPNLVELWQYSTKCSDMSCCLFAPDDSFVLFGKLETVLSIAERKEVPFFHGNEETFTSCAFSPNGKRLVTNDKYHNNIIKLWDVSRQSLLASLCSDVCDDLLFNWCSFSTTGLSIIIGCNKSIKIGRAIYFDDDVDLFCAWNAITWQRSDERNIRDVKLKEPGVFQDKKCKRCFRPGFKELNSASKRLEIEVRKPFTISSDVSEAQSTGIYNGVECSFSLKDNTLSVVENTHFTTLAAWNLFVYIYYDSDVGNCTSDSLKDYKLTTIEYDLWFYADMKKLIVFRTLDPTHQQSSRLPRPTRVLSFSSSFSPDGSRLATCTSDGYINMWNVITGQVEQSFKSNQGDSSFACWWSKDFLFVFDFVDRIPSLSKYPVDVNLKILFHQSQQVSLSHLSEEFISLSAIVEFFEGLLSFECGESEPVKVLDVSGVGGPRMVTLPGIEPGMSITVSPGASFVFGVDKYMYYIWKRIAKEELDVYEVFFTEFYGGARSFCFSNDSKVAVFADTLGDILNIYDGKIFDLVTRDHKSVKFDFKQNIYMDDKRIKLFCVNKDRVLIVANQRFLEFFDMDSGAHLGSSFQRYLTRDSLKQLKLSPKETMIACPKINGNMEFLRLCIPQSSELSSIKREATIKWHKKLEEGRRRHEEFVDSDDR